MSRCHSIDVVICTYNNAPLLDRTLTSLCNQICPSSIAWQVLVVNNNCTDSTETIVSKHMQASPVPLRMVKEATQGLTPARLRGVKSTTAEWIAFVDDDCLLEADWIAQAVSFIEAKPSCGAFGGRVTLQWEPQPPSYVLKYAYAFAEQEHGGMPTQVGCLVGAGIVIRRAALTACGWTEGPLLADRVGKKLVSGGDVEIALRVAANHDIWYNPACRLKHIIPGWRTTPQYLKAINFGLGRSKLLGDSMLWHGSHSGWLYVSVVHALRSVAALLTLALQALLGRKTAIELAVEFQFLSGWLSGIWYLLMMKVSDRQQLIGRAKVATSA